ncbi:MULTISPECIES: hypothetical protein [Rhizobium/Agrobacterium group]|uniref:hypothetical protein n=1 Tax=Rhizobium/Agrobacterium group TaxID=227290 RepID=UPI0009C95CBF|nr:MULTISPECIES: hypothetical protein [Rhizobium/Agrobacterium group]NIB58427.1 hypothetical protein [Agrobacterium tumefaciens]NSZ25226.1 hypothetical protein [Agrobacterium tumefaciens]NTB21315.1 hypothetical protein [Agrobacterium tumefaciens]QQE32042.1 hypothetical protein I6I05_00195 [Agrobacterium tumefaciens]CUX05056.1 hypothetical protein AGR1C_pAt20100 [Agrobacterium fabacearum TT111]
MAFWRVSWDRWFEKDAAFGVFRGTANMFATDPLTGSMLGALQTIETRSKPALERRSGLSLPAIKLSEQARELH